MGMHLSQFCRDLATSFCLWGKQLVNGQLGPNPRSEQWLSPHLSPNYCLGQMHKASKLSSFLGGFPGVKSTLTELLKQKVPWTTLKTVTQRHREVSYSSSIKNLTNCTSDFCFYFSQDLKKKDHQLMMTRTNPANPGLKTLASRSQSGVLSHITKTTGLKGKIHH